MPGRISYLIAVIILFFSSLFLNTNIRRLETSWVQAPNEQMARWHPKLFSTLTFGNTQTAIDWLWIKSMVDPAIFHVPKGVHPPLYYSLDLTTDLDPAFFDAYINGANLLAIIRDDVVGAHALLKKAERFMETELSNYPEKFRKIYWRQEWAIPFTLAYVELFELDDLPEAAKAFQKAAQIPGSPPYLASLSSRLSTPGGQYDVGLRLINIMLSQANEKNDVRIEKELAKKRESLFLSQYLNQLTEAFYSFVKQTNRSVTKNASEVEIKRHWKNFLKEKSIPAKDPWGGDIYMDEGGKVNSTTPRVKVFGLG